MGRSSPHSRFGNIAGDPLFAAAATGDYRLTAASPCIGKGSAYLAPATDIDGTPRDATPDMGAYEYVAPGATPVTLTLAAASGNALLADVPVMVNGDIALTPAQAVLAAGSEVVLAAPESIVVDGQTRMLVGWEFDGKTIADPTPTVTVDTDRTATAMYE